MELRHLKYFIAVAEELHFARAAERLHIEQSPLSRAIKDLEYHLGVELLKRTTRHTRLTAAGQIFLDRARHVLMTLEEAKAGARSAASGYHGRLRIGVSDGLAQPHLSALLARCREQEPDIEVRLFEMPFAQQVNGLRQDLLDAGLTLAANVGDGLVATPVWEDPIAVVVPVRHPLLAYPNIPLAEALRYPLVMCHPDAGSGCHQQVTAMLQSAKVQPVIADYATSLEIMLTLVGAGYGIGFAIASQAASFQRSDIVVRSLAGRSNRLTTYLVRQDTPPSPALDRFLARIAAINRSLSGRR